MIKLLLVDDVSIIVDGLYELFLERWEQQMEVFKAYSAPEAIDILKKTKIDIVVSDIKMPEISGIDLLEEINRYWPHCKVIFLTSYHDFDFARKTVVLGGFDYILKTEGDHRIVQAVSNAIDELKLESESEQLIAKAQAQYKLAQPMLQQQFLLELLQGMHAKAESRNEQFAALGLPFNPLNPIFLVIARMDGWKQPMTWSDKALLLYSVRNIMEEYLTSNVRVITVNFSPSQMVCIWQPNDDKYDEKEYIRAFRFFYGTLETIQNTCRQLLNLQMSFILGSNPTSWEMIGDKLQDLELLMQSGIGLNRELLTTEAELQSNLELPSFIEKANQAQPTIPLRLSQYSMLPNLLASGKEEDFFELFEDLIDTAEQAGNGGGTGHEVLFFLAHVFLGHINRRRLLPSVAKTFGLEKLLSVENNPKWQQTITFYRELAQFLFNHVTNEQEDRSNRLVQKVQQFIVDNLAEDLSLIRLGGQVHLNPTYLSRLYKQITGIGLSDFITEARVNKAKDLLENSDMKILEIAERLGYQSGITFNRSFKKMMNIAPQDYRKMHR